MTGIEKQKATVFYAPTRGRRFFSKTAAIEAEARALIYKEYPLINEPDEWSDESRYGGEHYDIATDHTDAYNLMRGKLIEQLKKGEVNNEWKIDYNDALWITPPEPEKKKLTWAEYEKIEIPG